MPVLELKKKDRQCTYIRNTGALSCNNCCSIKAISITYSECVTVALGIQHAMRMRSIILSVICGLPRFYKTFSHYLTNSTVLKKKIYMKHKMCVFFLQLVSETFLVLRRFEQGMIKNVYCSSCQVSVILVRFNLLKTKRNLFYIRNQFVPRSKHFPPQL